MQVNGFKSKAAAIREIRANGFNVSSLLATPESNPKVAKNGKLDVLTAPLHLAPASLSGFNVCPQASAGCIAACLHTAGNPAYMEGKQRSRIAKTQAYIKCRAAFMAVLCFEIAAHARKAVSRGMECGVRLNATSDIPWESVHVTLEHNGDTWTQSIIEAFPAVQFYDYTKITKRAIACATGYKRDGSKWPSNYHLTFSKSESNGSDCAEVLHAGGNVAAVVSAKLYKHVLENGALPYPYDITPAIDGDAHDYRPADPKGCIVALKAKGDARGDTSGFVIR